MTQSGESLPPDPRMADFFGGTDAAGNPRPMNIGALAEIAGTWAASGATPGEVAGLLKTSRDLFVASYYHYEFLTVSVFWSLLAVEAALRVKLDVPDSRSFANLIKDAHARGLLDDELRERLDAGRELRNSLGHARSQAVWAYGMVAPSLAAAHAVVAHLFPRE